MAANDDEFISNIALTESVKNCSILRHIRIEEYKDMKEKKRNGRTWHRSSDCSVCRPVPRLRRPIYMQHE